MRMFISYRRDDAPSHAGRLYDALAEHFGEDNVFMDVDNIEIGADFKDAIESAVTSCDVLFAMIGPRWLTVADSRGGRRLDGADDFVRLETALQRNVRVVPALLQGATMPRAEDLPATLEPLARRNAIEISDGPRWRQDVARLVGLLERMSGSDAMPAPGAREPVIAERAGGAEHHPEDPRFDDLAPVQLLERSEFVEALDESLASVGLGSGRLVLVSGEAGIGKSALVRTFCGAHREHARVLWGACDPLQTPRPLSPLIDIAATVEGSLLTSIRQGEKPHAVFLALIEELRAVTPTIAVLEDAHWADEATLDIIRLLARRAETTGALVVITYRDDGLDVAHPLRLAVGELGTAGGIVQLRLPPLSRGAVAELAGSLGIDAEELYVKSDGNPFFVTEVLAGGGTAVPATVRDAVLARMSRLGAAAQDVLAAVAVVPPHCEMWLLDEVVPDEVAHVDACLAAGILRGEGRTVSFRHELARLAVEQSLGPHRRVLLHRRVLAALAHPPEGAPDPAQLAHHADAAGDAGAALQHATAAGTQAASQGAHREAAAQYARAVRYAGSLPPVELAGLLERRAKECYLTNQIEEAVAAQERAVECYRELGDRRGEAAALCALSSILWCPGRIAESERAGRDALEALAGLEPGREHALVYANLAALAWWEDAETAAAWATRAVDLAERLGETEILFDARTQLDGMSYGAGAGEGRLRLERALEEATQLGLEIAVSSIWGWLSWAALQQRDYANFDRYLEAGLTYAGDHDHEMRERYLQTYRALAALDRARWNEAADAAGLALRDQGPSIVPPLLSLVVLALVRGRQGSAGASELLDRAAVLAEKQGQLHALAPVAAARAEIAWLEGRHDAVIAATDVALERAVRQRAWPAVGALSRWRWRAGAREHIPVISGPDAATVAGDWALAARLWAELGCPYDAALALGDADDEDARRRGLAQLELIGARPAVPVAR
jgi:AAA ATPase-like protein/TIR domain-containing protein